MFLRFLSTKREDGIDARWEKCFGFIGFLAASLLVATPGAAGRAQAQTSPAEPADYRVAARAFVADMVQRHGFEPVSLAALMNRARYRQDKAPMKTVERYVAQVHIPSW